MRRKGSPLHRGLAASVQVADCFAVLGTPFPMRFATGLLKPTYGVPGLDLAGTVVAVGQRVTRFQLGDAVFGVGKGTCAEYARAGEGTLAPKPSNLTFEQAAAMPTSSHTALLAIRDVGQVRPASWCRSSGRASPLRKRRRG